MNIRLAGAATAMAAALVLSACGEDSTDSDAEETAVAEATAEETATDEPTSEEASSEEAPSEDASAAGTVVDVAAGNPDFSTLVAAVEAAGLVETLSADGPYTVFAPTNEAFDALPAGVLDALLLPENQETLTTILTYHVVSGAVTSDQIVAGDVATVQGGNVTLATDAGVTVNDATVVIPDVPASNGVIHAIDAVLIPEGVDPAALVS